MSRLRLVCLLALVASTTGAAATGYDDFASGLAAVNRGENDQAISYFTSALAAGDLNADLAPVAYLERARAHLEKEDCAQAEADLTAALKLKADYAYAYILRGRAKLCAGDASAAIVDYSRSMEIAPSYGAVIGRGFARWSLGEFDAADSDFTHAVEIDRTEARPLIWDAMTRSRMGKFDPSVFATDHVHRLPERWPIEAFDLFRGRSTPERVMRAAESGDASELAERQCQANFYVAEWWIARGYPDSAKPLLAAAAANCPHRFIEYAGARVELKRLH